MIIDLRVYRFNIPPCCFYPGKVQNHIGTEFSGGSDGKQGFSRGTSRSKLFLTLGQAVPVNVSISRPLQKEGGLSFHGEPCKSD